MLNERSVKIDKACPSDPVQVLGFQTVPNAGEFFKVYKDDREAKNYSPKIVHVNTKNQISFKSQVDPILV